MKFFKNARPISISLSPNTEADDIWLAFRIVFSPLRWKKGDEAGELEGQFKNYFNVKYAISFNSGRSAFLAILKSLGLEGKNEVLLQAFTCNAAVNPVIWSGLKPKYVDCNRSDFNIDFEDLNKKVSRNSRVLMVQHTFGMPADMGKAVEFAKKNSLILIEDCAHALGAQYNGQKVGTFGKAAFFSFSRDKIISSVYGGVVITNDDDLARRIKDLQEKFGYPSNFWTIQQLIHPIILNWLILPIYAFIDLGKVFLVLSQWLHILSKAVHWKEKRAQIPRYFPKRLSNGLAILALNQFKKLNRFNEHRQKIADFYYQQLKNTPFILPEEFSERKNVFLRFAVQNKDAHSIIYKSWKKENILIGDWYTTPIAPADTKLEKMGYIIGMCPTAEKLSGETFNLPTHINISLKEAQRIVSFLKNLKNKSGE